MKDGSVPITIPGSLLDKQETSKSWSDKDFVQYDAMTNCRSAGIIPYTIYNDKLQFLLQKIDKPVKKKYSGWNDFGGKQIDLNETTASTAAREFSEETSCLFYLKENNDDVLYNQLKDNDTLSYNENVIQELRTLIPKSQKYYHDKITKYVSPVHISSKETYISYFVNVPYISASDLPRAEDIHINYDEKYLRTCQWFTLNELMNLSDKDFHKRLQITRIQYRLNTYNTKRLFQ